MADRQTQPRLYSGKTTYTNGWSDARQRGDYTGAAVVTGSGLSRFGEASLKGDIFSGSAVGLTLLTASGNTVGHTAAEAVTATGTSLFNPTTSQVAMILLRIALSVNSGTFAAGGAWHGLGVAQSVATSLSGVKTGYGSKAGTSALAASQGRIFEKATSTTYTGASAVQQLDPIAGTTATAAANGYLLQVVDEVDGKFVLLPGGEYRPLWTAVGTSVVYNIGYTWMEVPLASV